MSVIFTNGCFDIIHRGHLELLRYCKEMGYVIVGLNSDNSVKTLKGEDRPIHAEADRRFLLESLKYVDEVIIFDSPTPYDLIKEIKPDIIIKGGDYEPNDVVGADLCEVRIFKTINGYSTTKTVESINNRR